MPANDGRHGSSYRQARTRTISTGAGVILTLVLAACTTTTASNSASTAGPAAPASVSTGTGASGRGVTLTGAGSTFDAPFFDLAFARYQQARPAVKILYSAVGSSAGIASFSAQHADFGASDVPMTASEQAAARGGPVVQVPVDLGAEGVVYNLSLPAGSRLHLTGPVIARIFLGQITSWHDPAITALNPGINLPSAPISVVHRSDGSGTTYIFSNYLSSVSPAWAAKVGTGKTLHWPVGEGAEGNAGVGAAVYRTPFSIGYVEQSYSKGLLLPFAAIRNQAGHYTVPTNASITADAAQKAAITAADFSIVNEPGAGSYPICGYSWALIYTHQASQATGKALVGLMDWLAHSGQASAAAAGYVPLPSRIQALARSMLQRVTGPGGTQLDAAH
jgi:phosphate transport system substrate-binding protein